MAASTPPTTDGKRSSWMALHNLSSTMKDKKKMRAGNTSMDSTARIVPNSSSSGAADTKPAKQSEVIDAVNSSSNRSDEEDVTAGETGVMTYRTYRRRWFGLFQLVLLNIVVSWDWLSFAANSTTSASYFNVSESALNWVATSFLFSFVVSSPFTIYVLNRGGPKPSIIIASVLLLLGNWIRYGACRAGDHGNFGLLVFGQILTGLAQPFVLAAPTRYSDLWFTNRGRVAATAVTSLANPFGGALGELIDPFWGVNKGDIPNMVLYISIIATIATIPSFFIPAKPPTPVAPSSEEHKLAIRPSLRILVRSPEFWMMIIPFWLYVALFNSISSLINQILAPYGFDETESGIAGAAQIVVGLIASALLSPFIDRSKRHLHSIKVLCPVIGLCYLVFIFMPPTKSLAAVVVILAVMGASSFALLPVALEFLTEITHPVSPEITSTICWVGGQLLGGIFIIIETALTDGPNGGAGGSTPNNMQRALWFQAVFALVVVPLPILLGWFDRKHHVQLKRVKIDSERRQRETATGTEEGGTEPEREAGVVGA